MLTQQVVAFKFGVLNQCKATALSSGGQSAPGILEPSRVFSLPSLAIGVNQHSLVRGLLHPRACPASLSLPTCLLYTLVCLQPAQSDRRIHIESHPLSLSVILSPPPLPLKWEHWEPRDKVTRHKVSESSKQTFHNAHSFARVLSSLF